MVRTLVALIVLGGVALAQSPKGWTKGKGYGWVYGNDDEVGALNAVVSPEWVLAALKEVKKGRVYDLGVPLDRRSYRWPGHSPTEIITYRSPEGEKRQPETNPFATHPRNLGWHSCALFINDNVGTQIDGLGHIVTGDDHHWYNGFKEADHGSDFGVRKADADSIPPIVARAVLIDVAVWRGVDALPSNFPVGPKELQEALARQKTEIRPGDIVFIRTGTLRHWGEAGENHAKIAEHDSAGLTLAGAKWLVEEKGAAMIGSDTSGLEVGQDPDLPGIANPVHEYLLVEQGVHVGEFHNLEELSRNQVYRFTYIAVTNRLRGTTAGFAMRPLALE